ncbi:cyclin-like protein [Powellomyces hirtus]|nr:cyclin-like protein [Powellomyces hirtus]
MALPEPSPEPETTRPPEPYEESSQFRHWKLTSEELQHLRQKEPPECLTWEEQLTYCQFYEGRILDYCKALHFDRFVQATALAYFKRFYLRNTVMDYDPKFYLMTCVFLSTKVENAHISLSKFLESIPKSPSPDVMVELEFSLSKGIRFEYMVHHPFWPLHGFLLDVQDYIATSHPRPAHEHLYQKLQKCYSRAEQFASIATLTDLTFTHMPSQIGLGCLLAAARERDFEKELEQYLASRFHEKLDDLVKLRIALDGVAKAVTMQTEKNVDKATAAAIHKKLQKCQNPNFDPTSALCKHRRREEERERNERAAEKHEAGKAREAEQIATFIL